MKAVKVQYTVKPEYVEQNKRNIQRAMDAIKANPIEGMYYSSYTDKDNPNTFIHINMAKDAGTMGKLEVVKEFNEFRKALMESGPVDPPQLTTLDYVGAGFEM